MITYFLLGALAVNIIVVVELIQLIQSLKRLESCLAIKDAQMKHLFAELNAVETKAQESVNLKDMYEYEC